MTYSKTKFACALFLPFVFAGCAHHNHHSQNHNHNSTQTSLTLWQTDNYQYRPIQTHKLLSDYTEKLAMDLVQNMNQVSHDSRVAIASFVVLDDNLRTTNVLGNQLAESMVNEMQVFGYTVIDYKLSSKIEVTPHGDFVFSRASKKLTNSHNIDYVLSGTITYNNRGAIINARLVDTHSKVVTSTAKTYLPAFMIESLYGNSQYQNGVRMPVNASRY